MIISQPALHLTAEVAAWLVRRRDRMRVVGSSMEPTLSDGDYVLVERSHRPAVGELAVASPPGEPNLEVIKRVGSIGPDDTFWLVSDNAAEGTDSRSWGSLAAPRVRGRVTLNLSRPSVPLSKREPSSWLRWLRR